MAYNNSKNSKEKIQDAILRNIYSSKKNFDKKIISIMVNYFLINIKI